MFPAALKPMTHVPSVSRLPPTMTGVVVDRQCRPAVRVGGHVCH